MDSLAMIDQYFEKLESRGILDEFTESHDPMEQLIAKNWPEIKKLSRKLVEDDRYVASQKDDFLEKSLLKETNQHKGLDEKHFYDCSKMNYAIPFAATSLTAAALSAPALLAHAEMAFYTIVLFWAMTNALLFVGHYVGKNVSGSFKQYKKVSEALEPYEVHDAFIKIIKYAAQ